MGMPWTAVRLPFDPVLAWPVRVKLRVKGSIREADSDSEPYSFSTSLQGSPKRSYFLLVTGKMRQATKLQTGTKVEVVLEPDLEERSATPPPELAKLFKQDRAVKKWFDTLNYSIRKYVADTVAEPKSAEARVRRAEQWMERLMLIKDGEEFPPPILQVAFRRQPLARAGWEKMTLSQQRFHLLGVFMTQNPGSQAKRVERVVTEAVATASRTKGVKSASKELDQ